MGGVCECECASLTVSVLDGKALGKSVDDCCHLVEFSCKCCTTENTNQIHTSKSEQ